MNKLHRVSIRTIKSYTELILWYVESMGVKKWIAEFLSNRVNSVYYSVESGVKNQIIKIYGRMVITY